MEEPKAVEVHTGEVVPVEQVPSMAPMAVDQMREYVDLVDNYKNQIMKLGVDYNTIPGCGPKPTLLKPGAEKLAYAFNFAISYETVDHIKNYDEQFYAYEVRCTLTNKSTGLFVADCIGECNSHDPGKAKSSPNVIMKIAQKRAFVGAVLNATFSSDRYTQDIEDMTPEQRGGNTSKPATEKQINFLRVLASKASVDMDHRAEIHDLLGDNPSMTEVSAWIERLKGQPAPDKKTSGEDSPPDDIERPPDMEVLRNRCAGGERYVCIDKNGKYVPKMAQNTRNKHLGVTSLSQADDAIKLQAYLAYLLKKAEEIKAKKAEEGV